MPTTLATAPIALLGIPTEAGSTARGPSMGPASLRVTGIHETLSALGHDVSDLGDCALPQALTGHSGAPRAMAIPDTIAVDGGEIRDQDLSTASARARHWDAIRANTAVVAHRTYDIARQGWRPVFLGGDHSISMGTVAGVARHWREREVPFFVLWIDAHADFNSPSTSPSGNMHGMPLAALAGVSELAGMFPPGFEPSLSNEAITLLGVRSVDTRERQAIREHGLRVFDMRRIDELGVSRLTEQVIEAVALADGVLHVSFDVDALDPAVAPAVATTVGGGLSLREAHLIMEKLHDANRVCSLDIVELNPALDERSRSAAVLCELAASLFGRSIL